MKLFRPLLLAALIPLSLQAEPSASPSAASSPEAAPSIAPNSPDAPELIKLLQSFLAGASRNDVAMHDRFWADDLIYTASAGRRIGKADIMRDVRAEAAAPKTEESDTYSAQNIRVQQYGSTAIVAFELVGVTQKAGKTETNHYLNSGTFLKRNGEWRAVNWQATKIPAATPEH